MEIINLKKLFKKNKEKHNKILKVTVVGILASSFVSAGSCSNGFCGGVVAPYIPSDIQENTNLQPFNLLNKKQIEKAYKGWILVDNGGDNNIGENRLMSGIDFNSMLKDGDKLSLFGLISSENLKNGKLAYAYPLNWNDIIVEASYIQTNYSLDEIQPGVKGIGTNSGIKGKIIYPMINSEKEKLKFSLAFTNSQIDEERDSGSFISKNGKRAYSATANIDFETKAYPLFDLDVNHKLSLGITTGKLSFDNEADEKFDKKTLNTQGNYTKINLDYKNTLAISDNISMESKVRGQYALNNKNLDDSESFTIGGTNGAKLYEESTTYDSNGVFLNIEGKYKLPEFSSIKNKVGIFYDYGKIWASDSGTSTDDKISVQDIGLGLYTNYKKFFSRVQAAYIIGNPDVSTKDDKDYRIIVQAGIIF